MLTNLVSGIPSKQRFKVVSSSIYKAYSILGCISTCVVLTSSESIENSASSATTWTSTASSSLRDKGPA